MELQFLGGAGEVGRSALLIDGSLLIDYGTLTGDPPQYPVSRPEPDAVVVSHGHLDHVGTLPALLAGDRRPPIHWTPPTEELTHTLARDTIKLRGGSYDCPFTEEHVRRLSEVSERHGYREPFDAAGYEVTLYNAGHIPGSAHVLVDDGDTRLLYTGDFYVDEPAGDDPGRRPSGVGGSVGGQRLVAGSTARPEADVVVCESTYSDVEHPPRSRVEREFAESVRETVWEGGTVVVPAFAIGRTQEALLVLDAAGIDCYVDGMGVGVGRMLKRHAEYVRDADALRSALSNARVVDGRDGQRRRIASENTVIVTTSGMLSGGPAMTYVPEIRGDPTNKIAMTGYQVEGTPGRELLERGRAEIDGRVMPVAARVESHDLSAHADRDALLAFLDGYRDAEVLVNHGDRCGGFAAELRERGFEAAAPGVGDAVVV